MKSDTSVSGQSFKAKKTRKGEDDGINIHRPRAAKAFNRVQREKSGGGKSGRLKGPKKAPKISKAYPVRPSPTGPSLRPASRRCVVKVTYVANRKAGQWAAHGKYLEREGAQKEGELGEGFNASEDDVKLSSEMHKWQMQGDQRMFKIVISPEDGDRLDLKDYTRVFMQCLASHTGKDLEWVGIDHYNTGHPHIHIAVRGKDNLQISPDLIRNGMRKIAEEIATEKLGYKSEQEMRQSKEKEITARQYTGIDKDIQKRQLRGPDPAMTYVTEGRNRDDSAADRAEQSLRIRRLQSLESFGIAEKVGAMTWALDPGWDNTLKDLQVLQRRTAMVAQGRALMTDPRCLPVVSKVQPGEHLVGRVLGTGLDEQYDRSYLLIEGTDSRVHIVYQNAAIENQRSEQNLQPRSLVAVTGKSFEKDGKTVPFTKVTEYDLSIPDQHFQSAKIPEAALDDALDAGMMPNATAATGFQAVWHRQLLERQLLRAKEKERQVAIQKQQKVQEQQKRVVEPKKAKDIGKTRAEVPSKDKGKDKGHGIG